MGAEADEPPTQYRISIAVVVVVVAFAASLLAPAVSAGECDGGGTQDEEGRCEGSVPNDPGDIVPGLPGGVPLPVLPPTCDLGSTWKLAAVSSGQGSFLGFENWGALYYSYPHFDDHDGEPGVLDDPDGHAHFRAVWHLSARQSSIGADEFGYQSQVATGGQINVMAWEVVHGDDGQGGGSCGLDLEAVPTHGTTIETMEPGDDIAWDDNGYAFAEMSTSGSCTATTRHYESHQIGGKASYSILGASGEVSGHKKWGYEESLSCSDGTTTWDSEVLLSHPTQEFTLT